MNDSKRNIFLVILVAGGMLLPTTFAWAQPFSFTRLEFGLFSGAVTLGSVLNGESAAGDFNQDGLQDLITFASVDGQADGALFQNNGILVTQLPGGVTLQRQVFLFVPMALTDLAYSAVDLADVDGNGFIDILVAGASNLSPPYEPRTLVYLNAGSNRVNLAAELEGLHSGGAAWVDFDNDGDLDISVSGVDANGAHRTRLYANNGNLSFVDSGISFPGMAYGELAWADFDADGDMDLALSGVSSDKPELLVYRNDAGSFTNIASLFGVSQATVDWGDYDADGDLDLLVSGGRYSPDLVSGDVRVYRNSGSSFDQISFEFPGIFAGMAKWIDYDNDGDLDILLEGVDSPVGLSSGRVYRNEGGNSFTHTINLLGNMQGIGALADFDGDGDLDPYSFGLVENGFAIPALFRNDYPNLNFPPGPPSNLRSTVSGRNVQLQWDSGSDLVTPSQSLTYNLWVENVGDSNSRISPMVYPGSGKRLVSQMGNAGPGLTWSLRNLTPGTYTWTVQSIDSAYQGSEFAASGSFTISNSVDSGTTVDTEDQNAQVSDLQLDQGFPNPFTSSTTLRYQLPAAGPTRLTVYDVLGRAVRTLRNGSESSGVHQITWDGSDDAGSQLAAGVYFISLQTDTARKTSRVIVNR